MRWTRTTVRWTDFWGLAKILSAITMDMAKDLGVLDVQHDQLFKAERELAAGY